VPGPRVAGPLRAANEQQLETGSPGRTMSATEARGQSLSTEATNGVRSVSSRRNRRSESWRTRRSAVDESAVDFPSARAVGRLSAARGPAIRRSPGPSPERAMISLQDVREAADRIEGSVVQTPCTPSEAFGELFGGRAWFKFENLQRTGSFKERGALNRMLMIPRGERVARRHRRERRQPRAGRRLPCRPAGDAGHDRDARAHAAHQGFEHRALRRPGRAARHELRRGDGRGAPTPDAEGPRSSTRSTTPA
jgi:hypothetical protein